MPEKLNLPALGVLPDLGKHEQPPSLANLQPKYHFHFPAFTPLQESNILLFEKKQPSPELWGIFNLRPTSSAQRRLVPSKWRNIRRRRWWNWPERIHLKFTWFNIGSSQLLYCSKVSSSISGRMVFSKYGIFCPFLPSSNSRVIKPGGPGPSIVGLVCDVWVIQPVPTILYSIDWRFLKPLKRWYLSICTNMEKMKMQFTNLVSCQEFFNLNIGISSSCCR